MKELRFHRALYSESAVTEAVSVFDRYASIVREDQDEHFVVRVSSDVEGRERRVAGELGNYALGTSIRDQGAA